MSKKRRARQNELEDSDRPRKRVKAQKKQKDATAAPVAEAVQQHGKVDGRLTARQRKRKHDREFRRARAAPTSAPLLEQQLPSNALRKNKRKEKRQREKLEAIRAEAKPEILPEPRPISIKHAGTTQSARVPTKQWHMGGRMVDATLVNTDVVLDLLDIKANAQQYRLDWPFITQQAYSQRIIHDLQLRKLPAKRRTVLEKFYRPSHAFVRIEEATPPRRASSEPPQQRVFQAKVKPVNAFKPYVEPRITSVSLYRGDENIEATKARLRRSFNVSRGRPADATSESSSSSEVESSSNSTTDNELEQKLATRGSFQESWAKELAISSESEQIEAAEDAKEIPKDIAEAQEPEPPVGNDEADHSDRDILLPDQQFTIDQNGQIVLTEADAIPDVAHEDESSELDSSDAEPTTNEDESEHLNDVDGRSDSASNQPGREADLSEDPAHVQANADNSEHLSQRSDFDELGQNDVLDAEEEDINDMTVSESVSANIGIKRSGSQNSAQEAGSTQSKEALKAHVNTEQGPPSAIVTVGLSKYRYGQGDTQNTQELYNDIDNVAQDLFQSTRPLPQGMPTSPPNSDVRRGNQSLTGDRSNMEQHESWNGVNTDGPLSTDMSTAPLPEKKIDNVSQGSSDNLETESDSDDDDVKMKAVQEVEINNNVTESSVHDSADAGMYDSDGDEIEVDEEEDNALARPPTRSSAVSALTELGRTPSTPPKVVLPEAIQEAIAIANGTSSPAAPASAKKRQMTGRTSKHFSSPKSLPSKEARKRSTAIGYKTYENIPDRIGYVDLGMGVTRSATKSLPKPEIEKSGSSNEPPETDPESFNVTAEAQDSLETVHDGSDSEAPEKRRKSAKVANKSERGEDTSPMPSSQKRRGPTKKRKTTGAISEHFITDRVDKFNTTGKKRVAGVSYAPTPSINEKSFGLIQEKIWNEPFWLIIAVTFLNKTAGRSAVPVFWKIRQKWPQPYLLAQADSHELLGMIHHLGLQNQRCKRIKQIAHAWASCPPVVGKRFRILHYPNKGDGKDYKKDEIIEGDADDCAGAVELAHIPGCGRYAIDSWRIFCRDVMRGLAKDYNGYGKQKEDFEAEWKRVVPEDKELRACLRWMWLREGYIWDPLTGNKREATEEEMENAVKGQMEIEDEVERKFAAQAAGLVVSSPEKARRGDLGETPVKQNLATAEAKFEVMGNGEIAEGSDADEQDGIASTPVRKKEQKRNRANVTEKV